MVDASFDKLKDFLKDNPEVAYSLKKIIKDEDSFSDIEAMLTNEARIYANINQQVESIQNQRLLLQCDPTNAKDVITSLVKKCFVEDLFPVIILTATNYKSMMESLARAKIDPKRVVIIDTVSKSISFVKDFPGVHFIDSLRNLTQIQIKSVNLAEKIKKPCFIFDTITVLDLYHKEDIVMKFFYSYTKLLHKKAVPGVFLVCAKKANPRIIQFFDDFITITKI